MLTESADLRIESFDPARHDRAGFSCGVDRLNNYLKLSAKKQQKDDMTRVYVVVESGGKVILGYHAINLGMMNVDELTKCPRGAPDHGELPILFLGQVAVSRTAQGQGIGSILMHHVFLKAAAVAEQAGCYAIVLDVMSDGGDADFRRRKGWYAEFGFQAFASNPARMFMTMDRVRGVLEQ
jgi:GNAT superfamily N-acetyltransferase